MRLSEEWRCYVERFATAGNRYHTEIFISLLKAIFSLLPRQHKGKFFFRNAPRELNFNFSAEGPFLIAVEN